MQVNKENYTFFSENYFITSNTYKVLSESNLKVNESKVIPKIIKFEFSRHAWNKQITIKIDFITVADSRYFVTLGYPDFPDFDYFWGVA